MAGIPVAPKRAPSPYASTLLALKPGKVVAVGGWLGFVARLRASALLGGAARLGTGPHRGRSVARLAYAIRRCRESGSGLDGLVAVSALLGPIPGISAYLP